MKEWFTAQELADKKLPDMPATKRNINQMALREGWNRGDLCRKAAQSGGGFEYHMSLLPHRAQVMLAAISSRDVARDETREKRKRLYWSTWEAMTEEHRVVCHARLAVLTAIDQAQQVALAAGTGESAKDILERVLDRFGVSRSSVYAWRKLIHDVDQEDWLPALAPKYAEDGTLPKFAPCHALAWDALKSDYLRPEKPTFSACYRRVTAAAKEHGWAPIPSEKTLRRRIDAEVEPAVQTYAREGKKKAEQLYPPQVRTKDHLHALEIVNTDGHKIDLFVWAPWNTRTPVRVILIGIQDVYSGKILSWRLTSAETWDVVRACIGDMIEDHGIPEHFYMDNGRAFASNAISGGAKHRNRFRKKTTAQAPKSDRIRVKDDGSVYFEGNEEEFGGILLNFGIEPHFTRPYAGQSKPIERAWKDLAEEICKHPAMSGAYTGNKPDAKPENYRKRAIPLDVLQAHVADRIAEHNSRPGRKAETAAGRSFDETFDASMRHPATIIRRATDAQRDFWMLAEHVVKVRKNRGEIHYQKNIYWADALTAWSGKTVKIRFDPDRLHEGIKVYQPDGRLICEARCTEKGRFRDVEAANLHNRNRKAFVKAKGALAEIHRRLSPDELADVYGTQEPAAPKKPVRPAVTRLATGNLAVARDEDVITNEEFEAGIAANLLRISGDSSIIPFPSARSAARKNTAEK